MSIFTTEYLFASIDRYGELAVGDVTFHSGFVVSIDYAKLMDTSYRHGINGDLVR